MIVNKERKAMSYSQYDFIISVIGRPTPPEELLLDKKPSNPVPNYDDEIKELLDLQRKVVGPFESENDKQREGNELFNVLKNLEKQKIYNEFEEWVENMSYLKYGLKHFKNPLIYLKTYFSPFDSFLLDKNGNIVEKNPKVDDLIELPIIGPLHTHLSEKKDKFCDDISWDCLQPFLGRKTLTTSVDSDDEEVQYSWALKSCLDFIKENGPSVAKFTHQDKQFPSVGLFDSEEDVSEWLLADPYFFSHGRHKKLTLSEKKSWAEETRFFIVDGNVVTLSLNHWNLTPLWSGSEPSQEHLALMTPFVNEVVNALASSEKVKKQSYVVDVAIDTKTNECNLVELNALNNSGLYSANPEEIVLATKKNSDQFLVSEIFEKRLLKKE